MQSIGIDAVGVGAATALMLAFNLVFDIPSGIIADRWSRKGVLIVSALAMASSSLLLGLSKGLPLYLVGYLFYGIYVVATSGTYQAITYDVLHEEGRASEYSKIMGRAYALFLAGAGVANIFSGFLANQYNYQFTFFLSVVSCFINIIIIATIKEPTFHKLEQKEKVLQQLGKVVKAISKVKLLQLLTVIATIFAVVELYKNEFGQLYMLQYISQAQWIGLLWAAYAFCWALGSVIAHRFRARLNLLIAASVVPLIAMSLINNYLSLFIFMFQAVASAAMINQIETRVQESTPSAVRATILSVLSSLGRGIAIPASFVIGWLIRDYDALWALRFVTLLASISWMYWLVMSRGISKANEPIIAG